MNTRGPHVRGARSSGSARPWHKAALSLAALFALHVAPAASDEGLERAERTGFKRVEREEPVDLRGVATIEFALPAHGTIRSFRNVEAGKIYLFRFANGNTTISRDNAFLLGGLLLTPSAGSDIVFVGHGASVRQVTRTPPGTDYSRVLSALFIALALLTIFAGFARDVAVRRAH